MKLTIFKSNKIETPDLALFRPKLFNINLAWALCLFGLFVTILAMALVGSFFFYKEYSEDYKSNRTEESTNKIINTDRLKNVVNNRNTFINTATPVIRDPSI